MSPPTIWRKFTPMLVALHWLIKPHALPVYAENRHIYVCILYGFQYALKKISIENLGGDYVHEATVLCQLNHSNVLAYKTCFRYHNSFCLVMEYCPGGDLSKDIERRKQRRQPFNERDVVNWTIQLCHALEVRILT